MGNDIVRNSFCYISKNDYWNIQTTFPAVQASRYGKKNDNADQIRPRSVKNVPSFFVGPRYSLSRFDHFSHFYRSFHFQIRKEDGLEFRGGRYFVASSLLNIRGSKLWLHGNIQLLSLFFKVSSILELAKCMNSKQINMTFTAN